MKELARTLYETYCDDSGWKNFQGNPCPQWVDLPIGIQSHWKAVADKFNATHSGYQQFVDDRLLAMEARPMMWASTREAFGLQLMVVVEVATIDLPVDADRARHKRIISTVFGRGSTGPREDIDEEWGRAVVARVRTLLKELGVR